MGKGRKQNYANGTCKSSETVREWFLDKNIMLVMDIMGEGR